MSGDELTPLQRAQLRQGRAVREAIQSPTADRKQELLDATEAVRDLLAARRKKRRK
jgi:hypothetical protein